MSANELRVELISFLNDCLENQDQWLVEVKNSRIYVLRPRELSICRIDTQIYETTDNEISLDVLVELSTNLAHTIISFLKKCLEQNTSMIEHVTEKGLRLVVTLAKKESSGVIEITETTLNKPLPPGRLAFMNYIEEHLEKI